MNLVNKIKHILFLVVVLLISFSLVGCNEKSDEPTIEVKKITITGERSVIVGEKTTLTVTTDLDEVDSKYITWKSSNPNVATVENGVVEGIKTGEVTISVAIGNRKATHNMKVITLNDSENLFNEPKILTPKLLVNEKIEFVIPEKNVGYVKESFNPYDYTDIFVYGVFTTPNGDTLKVPAFWYRDYEITINENYTSTNGVSGTPSKDPNEIQGLEQVEWLSDEYEFRLRFMPTEVGKYRYTIYVEEKGIMTQAITGSMEVLENPNHNSRGIIKVDKTTNRNFVDGNNNTFIPVGINLAWWTSSSRKTYDYNVWLDYLSKNNANMARVWLATWGMCLHWNKSIDNFDRSLNNAARLDKVIELFDKNNMYIQLCLLNHGQFSTNVNSEWSKNPYNTANGGIISKPEQFFSSDIAKATYKKELMYIVARYGYSDKILAWELFNEVDWTDNATTTNMLNIKNWHEEMAEFVRENDCYNHMITTSYKSTTGFAYSLENIDYVNPHDYGYAYKKITVDLPDSINWVYDKYKKPVLESETGINWQSGNAIHEVDGDGDSLRQALWAGMMSGGAGAAMQWWWDSWVHPHKLYYLFNGPGIYAKHLNLSGSDYSLISSTNSKISSGANVMGYKFTDRIYGYVFNSEWTHYSTNEKTLTDVSLEFEIASGSYVLEIFDTVTGEIIKTIEVESVNNILTFMLPSFDKDIAFIVRK